MARLELDGVEVRLGGRAVLPELSLTVEEGECLALLGPSGCGKTTTLRTVAGFLRPSRGDVRIAGRSVAGVPTERRNVGIVFQDYALFPHMTVAGNVAYGLQARRVPAAEIRRRVAEALEMVHLPDFAARYPEEMSGGQKQRVALARAIVVRPDILLLDEPLGALDRRLRDAMQVELKQLQRSVGITTIIVTHDQEEALSLSHRVAVMFDGRLAAVGTPAELYADPGSAAVMDFLGAVNLVEGIVAGGWLCGIPVPAPDGPARFGIRPEHVGIAPDGALACTVEEVVFKGPAVSVLALAPDGRRIHASAPAAAVADMGLARGGAVRLNFPARHLVRLDWPEQGGRDGRA